jgi:cephalosporin hydroxylase
MKLSEQYKLKNYNTDKNTDHSYIDYLYNDITDQNYTDILEIGAFNGGSALLWQDYFINANIDILDINECQAIKNQPRINHIVGNAYSDELIKNLRTYDLIIDDGPHTLESMIYFIDNYTKLLKINGTCVIEDIQTINWFNILIARIPNNCFFQIVDLRNIKNRYDDLVLIIRRIK